MTSSAASGSSAKTGGGTAGLVTAAVPADPRYRAADWAVSGDDGVHGADGCNADRQLRTVGTVTAHFKPAYDILVRPKGARSLVLFVLILVVCVLFVANSAAAAIRGRRRELGVLACLGWTRPRLFTAVLGELAAIGRTGSLTGAALGLTAAATFAGQLPVTSTSSPQPPSPPAS